MPFSSYSSSVLSFGAAVLPGGGPEKENPGGSSSGPTAFLCCPDFPAAGSSPIVPVALVRDTGVGSGAPCRRVGLVSAAVASDTVHIVLCFSLHR